MDDHTSSLRATKALLIVAVIAMVIIVITAFNRRVGWWLSHDQPQTVIQSR